MPRQKARKPGNQNIARERVEKLLDMAEKELDSSPELSDRYVEKAWKMALKYNVRFTPGMKKRFCRKCLTCLVQGKTAKTRVTDKSLVIICLKCGNRSRFPPEKRKVLK